MATLARWSAGISRNADRLRGALAVMLAVCGLTRAILASWASDACAIEAAALREPDDGTRVRFDDVLDALKELDRRYGDLKPRPRYRRILERRIPGVFGRDDDVGEPGPALI